MSFVVSNGSKFFFGLVQPVLMTGVLAVNFTDPDFEQHSCILQVRMHPDYDDEAQAVLRAMLVGDFCRYRVHVGVSDAIRLIGAANYLGMCGGSIEVGDMVMMEFGFRTQGFPEIEQD